MRPPLFDYADQAATVDYGRKLQEVLGGAPADPTRFMNVWGDIGTAWLRLWGLAPPPERPGARAGKWKADE